MSTDDAGPVREYRAIIWIGDQPGARLRIPAKSLDEAKLRIVEEYGEGHVMSIWNEEDAAKPR